MSKRIKWRRAAPVLGVLLLFYFWAWPSLLRPLYYRYVPVGSRHLPLGDQREFLLHSQKFTLYSISSGSMPITDDPKIDGPYRARYSQWISGRESLHDYPVIGKVEIADTNQRNTILSTIYSGIAGDSGGGNYMCFDPRHAIRAQNPGKVVDVLICFRCASVHAYVNGKLITTGISKSPQSYLDSVLTQGGAELYAPNFNQPLPPAR